MHQNGTNLTICLWDSKAIVIATYSSLMMLSLVGNSLLIAVFYRNKSLRTPVHYFIMNMLVSDLIIPTISLPTSISVIYHDWQWMVGGGLGTVLCKFVSAAGFVSFSVSMFSMVAIAIDRFYAIVFVMKPALFSKKTCHRLIIASWIVSVAIQGYNVDAARLELEGSNIYCDKGFDKISILCLFAITALVLTLLYSIMIVFLYHQKMDPHLANESVELRAKENRKITLMLVIIVIAFYLVWIPFLVFNLKEEDVVDECYWAWESIAGTLPMFYTVINSLVFVIFIETFREGCRQLLCRPWVCTKCNVCSLASVTPQEHNETFRQGSRELLCRPWFCTKCIACSLASVTPQEHNETAPNSRKQNYTTAETSELQEL